MNPSTQTSKTSLTNPANDFLRPATIKSLFWRPRFTTDSPVLVHAPFLFWMGGVKSIRRAAVLGADDGFAHFLFCQSIDKIAQEGRCYGFGFWPGDNQKKTDSIIPSRLAKHSEDFYEEISELRQVSSASDALNLPEKGSLDAFFVDLETVPNSEIPRLEDFSELLADQAVLVLHGTNQPRKSSEIVGSLFKKLEAFPRVVFTEGVGLTVFLIGKDRPHQLESLLANTKDGTVRPEFETIFRRLGRSLVAVEQVRTARSEAKISSAALKETKCALLVEREKNIELQHGYDQRSRKLSEIQSSQYDLQNEMTDLRIQSSNLTRSLTLADAEICETKETLSELNTKLTVTQANLDAEYSTRCEEVARLANVADELRTHLAGVEAERNAERQSRLGESAALTKIAENMRKTLSDIKAELEIERGKRLDEGAASVEVADDLRRNLSAAKADLGQERRLRFDESVALTRIAEDLRKQLAKSETKRNIVVETDMTRPVKSRIIERWLTKYLLLSRRKFHKYERDRDLFFRDSKSTIAAIYFWFRP